VQRLGHSMKGAGVTFGFQAITDMGAGLEHMAGAADAAACRKWVDDLSSYLDRVARGADGPHGGRSPARKIVIVEDSDDLRAGFLMIFRARGHAVLAARHGVEGLDLILAEKPDVAVIDMSLPGMDGNEIARRVRVALGHSVRLIALTGHAGITHRREALAAGFDLYLTKPVKMDVLERALEAEPTKARSSDPPAL